MLGSSFPKVLLKMGISVPRAPVSTALAIPHWAAVCLSINCPVWVEVPPRRWV